MASTTVTRIPNTLVALFDKEGLTIQDAFALIEQHWNSLKRGKSVSPPTPRPENSPVSISPTVIRNQIDLALEENNKTLILQLLKQVFEKTEIEGSIATKAGDRPLKARIALKTKYHKGFSSGIRELLE